MHHITHFSLLVNFSIILQSIWQGQHNGGRIYLLYGFRVYKPIMARKVGRVISLVLGSRLSLMFISRLTRNQRDWTPSWPGYDLQRPISGAHFCLASFTRLCKHCHLLRKKYSNTQACRGSIYIQNTAFSYS